MKLSKKFIDPNLSNEQRDQIMEDLLKSKFDSQLRDKYSKILRTDYGLERSEEKSAATATTATATPTKSKSKVYLALGAMLTLIALSFAFFNRGPAVEQAPQNKAKMYLAELSIDNKNVTRNTNDERAPALIAATKAFNDKNYEEAIKQYALVDQLDNENLFFRSVANMKLGKTEEAERGFMVLRDQINEGEAFKSETNLYLYLCLKLQSKDAEASKLLNSFGSSSWEYKEGMKISE